MTPDSSGNSDEAPQGQQPDEQPDYPDELLPADQQAAAEGAQQVSRHEAIRQRVHGCISTGRSR
jgi:hypothetical protein